MNKKISYKFCILMLLVFIGIANAYGTEEHFFNSIKGKHFKADSSLTVKDDKYGTSWWDSIQKNQKVTDIITLEMNQDTNIFVSGAHTCRVDLDIKYTNALGHVDSIMTSLAINFNNSTNKPLNYRTSFRFLNGYSVTAKILAVWYDGSISTTYPSVFTLSGDVYITRIYKFTCSAPPAVSHTTDATNARLDISWPPVTGADGYDLEFAMYDDSSSMVKNNLIHVSSTTYTDFGFLFTNNATRVTLSGNSYSYSLIYNPGYIFYRLRPIHYDSLGNRIEGAWSSDIGSSHTISYYANTYNTTGNAYLWTGHENSLNWQYTAAFAEEGKRKEVTSYFDGTLRNRQSVTLNNSENKAIVGETIYDFQGRPAVTTLPAPIDSGKIVYYNKFNVDYHSPTDSEYNRKDFDTGSCSFIPAGMDSTRGSSQYYSSSNPDKAIGFNAYLPDAQAYPFTMTEYTPDNTGRISRQSIAGKTHRLGSGHETKYYYGKPAQEELDRLFGNEVGNNSHYLENMVIDANGQISVSYVDANGKTVATALAGQPPSNVQPINSYYPQTTLNINLLDGDSNHPTNTSILSNYTLLATNTGTYSFAYKLYPGNYTDSACNSSLVCTDCLYDVQLVITDDCGYSLVHNDSNLTYTQLFDTLCGHHNIIDTFSVWLQPGSYNISRLITIDPKAIAFYNSEYLRKNSCLKTYSSFLTNAIVNTNFSGCNMTCATCLTSLGTQSAFLTKYIVQLDSAGESISTHQDTLNADTAYSQALAQCNALCAPSNICTGLYSALLADVSLGGQYCKDTLISSVYFPSDSASVLREIYYEHPITPYVNSAGQADTVVIAGIKYTPQSLPLTQFVQNWKPSWASSLVWYHPEFCFWIFCELDSASNRYDADMVNTNTYSAACSAGFLAPLGSGPPPACNSCNIANRDPFFTKYGMGKTDSNLIRSKLDNYVTIIDTNGNPHVLSLWATVALMMNCTADTLNGVNMRKCYTPADTIICGACAGDLNMEWEMFVSLYQSMKQEMVDSLEYAYVAGPNGCLPVGDCVGMPYCTTPYNTKVPRHISIAYAESKNFSPSTITPTTAKHFADSAMTANCDSVCRSYAYSWYQQLNGCGSILHTDSVALIQGFLAVCEDGCNFNHPSGASTTPNGIPDANGDISFEDVIHRVLGKSYSDTLCNGTIIAMPMPYYDSTGIAGPMVTYYKPSPCECENLDTAYYTYHIDSLSGETAYKNFGDFLTKYYGDSISEASAWSIKSLCTGSCFFASAPIQMPLWVSCCQNNTGLQQVTVAGGTWTVKANVGNGSGNTWPVFDAVSFSIGDSGYVIGGDTEDHNVSLTTVRIWNQSTNTWTSTASPDSARRGGIGFAHGGKGYVGLGNKVLGGGHGERKDLRCYNPVTNTWTNLTSADSGRNNSFAFVIKDTAYIGCGDTLGLSLQLPGSLNCFSSVWKYDINADSWTKRSYFPGGKRTGMAAFSIGNYGYAGCGMDNNKNLHNDMWRFNPSTNTWTSIAPLPLPSGVYGTVSFVINGKGYVGMGMVKIHTSGVWIDTNLCTNQFWQYDTGKNQWSSVTPFTGSRATLGVGFSIGNYGYAGAGVSEIANDLALIVYKDFGQLSVVDTAKFAAPECCITCALMDTGVSHFTKAFPTLSSTSYTYANLYTNYLNNYFGYNMTYAEYQQFSKSCGTSHTITLHDGTVLPLTLCNRAENEAPPITDTNTCYTYLMMDATYNATNDYNNYIDSMQNAFKTNYIAHCIQVDDSFHLKMPFDEYHYTLYYYDQAENLVKTVPPQGVHPINLTTATENSIQNYREYGTGSPTYPVDSMQTRYWYSTLNSPIQQVTPDGDTVHFWYDRLGRVCLTQNAVQRPFLYSYTQYDALGRIIEVGQVNTVPANLPSCFNCVGCAIKYGVLPILPDTFTHKDPELQNFINTGTKSQVTHTYYDTAIFTYIPLVQQNLRKRIASISYQEVYDNVYSSGHFIHEAQKYDNAIHYTYDIEGNVASMIVDVPHDSIVKQRYKRTDYYYDLVSGKVNELIYEHDSIDQFIHNYEYDADNRITDVLTSRDSLQWEHEVGYEYYDHGPLAREVIGRRQVQGVDYANTINGWIKGVNSGITNPSYDMGFDGNIHGANNIIARDAYGFTLNYFNGDYRPIGASKFEATAEATGLNPTSLYNGNVSGATYSIKPLSPKSIGYSYGYDQLNRMVSMQAYQGIDTVNNNWGTGSATSNFKEQTNYDENGNILTYIRHGNTAIGPQAMDSLNYHYTKGRDQLTQVNDAVPATNYSSDIHNETSSRNYQYNGIGELARDSAGSLDTIIWSIYGKVKTIRKYNGDSIVFFYDPVGSRLEKRNYPHSGIADTTKYARDAQSNTLAIYYRKKDTVRLTEWDIYGSKRIGTLDTSMRIYHIGTISDTGRITYLEGQRQYELTNHLGNVLVTISDKKIASDTNSDGITDYYLPNIINVQDYYPFGMIEPGRNYLLVSDSLYSFAFNGKLHDDQVYGKDNSYDYGARFYDPRLGRWLSPDPSESKHPAISAYDFSLDSPLMFNDPDGRDSRVTVDHNADGGGTITISTTIWLTGEGATPKLEKSLNDNQSKTFKSGTYTDKNGKVFTIKFEVKYKAVSDKSQIQLQKGDNVVVLSKSQTERANTPGTMSATTDNKGNVSYSGTTGDKSTVPLNNYSNNTTTIIHETGHLIGLDERYTDITDPKTGMVVKSVSDEGYGNNIMAADGGTDLGQAQYDNIGAAYSGLPNGTSVQNKRVEVDSKTGKRVSDSETKDNSTKKVNSTDTNDKK